MSDARHPVGFRAVFLGPPGAGKGTQAKKLADRDDVLHVSTGDMLREHVARGTELGAAADRYMRAGELVPDDLIIRMVEERLDRPDASGKAWILDGFPRTLNQAEALDASLLRRDAELTHVVYFAVPHEALVERLAGRFTCAGCGAISNANLNPPARPGVCDACGGKLEQRPDDRPEAVAKRLREYDSKTRPLLDFYRSRGRLVELPADRAPDAVFAALLEALAREAA